MHLLLSNIESISILSKLTNSASLTNNSSKFKVCHQRAADELLSEGFPRLLPVHRTSFALQFSSEKKGKNVCSLLAFPLRPPPIACTDRGVQGPEAKRLSDCRGFVLITRRPQQIHSAFHCSVPRHCVRAGNHVTCRFI